MDHGNGVSSFEESSLINDKELFFYVAHYLLQ